ncbi:MAG: C40 family peptidase [Thermoleophilia bacterium]
MQQADRRTPWWAVVLTLVLGVAGVFLGSASVLAADRWEDISDATWQRTYGVSCSQVATVAEGYSDGTFRPSADVLRGQFAKMSLTAFALKMVAPSTPTFADVPRADFYYPWVEGGVAAGIIAKQDTYRPRACCTRGEAGQVVAAYLVQKEMAANGTIAGDAGTYSSLDGWYEAEGELVLRSFADADAVPCAFAPAIAYLIHNEVLQGGTRNGRAYLDSAATVTRAQAVVFILRSMSVGVHGTTVAVPAVATVGPMEGLEAGGIQVGDRVVAEATKYLGVPYVWAGDDPSGFDCSGLVQYVYAKFGVKLPHSSAAQYNCGPHVAKSDLRPGDLVFYYTPIRHVGIYIGDGKIINARTGGVRIDNAFWTTYVGATRVLP